MKIAIVIDSLQTGGAEWQSVISAAEFHARGHDVHLLTTYHGRNDYADFIQKRGIHLVESPCRRQHRAGRVWALFQYMCRARFDVVHAFDVGSTRYASVAAKFARVPCVFGGYRSQISDGRILQWINRVVTRNTAGWIVNGSHVKDFLVANHQADPKRVFVVPNGTYTSDLNSRLTRADAKAKFGVGPLTSVVSMVANLHQVKNHPMFLNAAKRVVDSGQKPIFLVAGEGPAREQLDVMARGFGIKPYVRFLDRCTCVPDLLRATEVAALTSFKEGLPNALIEAGAASVPAVSSDNGGAAEVIVEGETGYVVPVNDDTAMAERFLRLLNDLELRERMGEAARRTVREKFSADAMATRLIDVYKKGLESAK